MTNKETIYRQDVLDLAKKGVLISNGNYESVCKAINEIPSVTPQPCEDAINRQAVLELAEWFDLNPQHFSVANLIDEVENIPSVTPQEPKTGHWIPVSERLPEDRREVLVTAYWHETYQVMMASYYGDGLWWCVPFNNCGEHMQRLNPKAWMPLPKPYEPQERSEE